MVLPFGICDISERGGKRSSSDLTSIDDTNGNEITVSQRTERKPTIRPALINLHKYKTIPVRKITRNIITGIPRYQ
jgi:hypothetical protein